MFFGRKTMVIEGLTAGSNKWILLGTLKGKKKEIETFTEKVKTIIEEVYNSDDIRGGYIGINDVIVHIRGFSALKVYVK